MTLESTDGGELSPSGLTLEGRGISDLERHTALGRLKPDMRVTLG